jgi:outer membrane protein TolC
MAKQQPTEIPSEAIANESRTPRAEDIARRAYAIYEERGRIDGADLDDWLQAERELRQNTAA